MSDDLVADRSDAYNSQDPTAETVSRMNKRLAGDFRERVRCIAACAPFSSSWPQQVDYVQYLASVAVMEEREAKSKGAKGNEDSSALKASGSTALLASESQTLWERDEFCARYIVEEGKINLIMRLVAEFKQHMMTKGSSLSQAEVAQARAYETSLGVLLRVTMKAVEAVQTLDLRAVLEHISATWDYFLDEKYQPPTTIAPARHASPSKDKPSQVVSSLDFIGLQEGQSFCYLSSIMGFMENLQEEMLMEKMFDLKLVQKLLSASEKMLQIIAELPKAHGGVPLSTAAGQQVTDFTNDLIRLWVALLQTDTYKSKMATFWPGGKPDKVRFVKIMDPLVKTHLAANPDAKRDIRPLTDTLLRFS